MFSLKLVSLYVSYVSFRLPLSALQTASLWLFSPLSRALGTINPTDYSAPLLLDWTFTISRGRQQWGPDESNIHGISFTLLPLSHAPPPLCQAPVWWEGLLTLAAPIDRQFCNDRPRLHLPPLPPFAPEIGNKSWLEHGAKAPAVWAAGGFVFSFWLWAASLQGSNICQNVCTFMKRVLSSRRRCNMSQKAAAHVILELITNLCWYTAL